MIFLFVDISDACITGQNKAVYDKICCAMHHIKVVCIFLYMIQRMHCCANACVYVSVCVYSTESPPMCYGKF